MRYLAGDGGLCRSVQVQQAGRAVLGCFWPAPPASARGREEWAAQKQRIRPLTGRRAMGRRALAPCPHPGYQATRPPFRRCCSAQNRLTKLAAAGHQRTHSTPWPAASKHPPRLPRLLVPSLALTHFPCLARTFGSPVFWPPPQSSSSSLDLRSPPPLPPLRQPSNSRRPSLRSWTCLSLPLSFV